MTSDPEAVQPSLEPLRPSPAPAAPAPGGLLLVTRALLITFSTLTLLAVVVLFGRPADTAEFFAWTIKPPLTAAFLGAGYGAGCLLVLLSLRAAAWPAIRIPLLTIAVFTAVSLAATLMHLDKFHLDGPLSVATFAGWFWLFIYIVIPPSMLVVWWIQDRRQPPDPDAGQGLPRWLAGLLAVQGVVMLGTGVVLFADPPAARTLWPWPLTPLTARAVAAWLISFGLATVYAAAREKRAHSRIQAIAYTGFGALELLALARFPATADWGSAPSWIYLAFAVTVTATGAAGIILTARDGTAVGAAGVGAARDGAARDGAAQDGTARDGAAQDGTA